MLHVLLKFIQNGPKRILFFFKIEKRPNSQIIFSRKLFQKRPGGNPVTENQKQILISTQYLNFLNRIFVSKKSKMISKIKIKTMKKQEF